jgi:PST family polysaccharide transporter
LSLIALVFCVCYLLPLLWATGIGVVAVIVSILYSIRTLAKWVSFDSLPGPIRRIVSMLGLERRTRKFLFI